MNVFAAFKANDEAGRLAALQRYEALDSTSEKEFDQIVTLVQTLFKVPFVAINLIDNGRQFMQTAAGMSPMNCRREDTFCDQTIRGNSALAIENAALDPRFAANLHVCGASHIRSYLGVPLTSPDGYNIGALCVFDTKPRKFLPDDIEVLGNFAKIVMSQFELRLIARQDSLTGALTRRAFFARLDRAVVEEEQSSLLMLDLDHFKQVNDTHGHAAGDLVLRRVSECLMANLRNLDSIGRLGGEEFGVLLAAVPEAEAMEIAERLRLSISSLKFNGMDGFQQTVSIGVAGRRGETSQCKWLARADEALYAAKHSGRNTLVLAA